MNEVLLSSSPWVSGTRVVAWYGPVCAVASDLDEALDLLAAQALLLGANAVTGLECTIDAEKPDEWRAVGTAGKLEAMYDSPTPSCVQGEKTA